MKLQNMQVKKCEKKGCQLPATSTIHMSFAVNADHEPAISTPLLYLCDEHSVEATWESLCVDHNWETICNGFKSIGREAPVKEFCKVIIEPIK